MNRLLYFVLLFLFPLGLIAQERIVPLHGNRKVMLAAKQLKKTHRTTSVSLDTIPFLDDFSKPGPYPDSSKWIDKKVYVNYGNPVCPHTLGVATFDGLDSIGKPYNPAASPYSSSPGDVLTSKPITWTTKFTSVHTTIADSVYLSFYYQAGTYFGTDSNGGVHRSTLGYWPKTNDTLLLQFRAGGDTIWNTVWYHLGYQPVQDTDTTFHLVMIPFDTGTYTHSMATLLHYFNDGFQFRFLAYSCGSGNVDHWSIDEVYLNARNFTGGVFDTMQNDLAFAYEAPPLLSQYSAEPWEQYQPSDLRSPSDLMPLFERNNNATATGHPGNIINATYNYSINTSPATTYSGGAINIYPFIDSAYNRFKPQSMPSLTNTTNFPTSLTGPTEFTITHYFDFRSNDFDQWNDTVRFNQVFNNYYAYDDGSAEASYFINPIPGVPPFFAYQFTLNKPDSVFGLAIYFDYLFVDNASYSFILALWDDNGGQPGKMIYQDTINVNISNPIYQFDGNDEFTNYYFQKEQSLPAGKFYIGWVQTLGDSMNIGYDWNSNHEDRVFYSLDESNWQESSYPGTPMMRPFVGGYSQYVGINNIETHEADIGIYPNPAQNELNISGDNLRNAMVRIMGEDGRVIYEDDHFSGNTINTSSFPAGFYIVQVTPEHKQPVFKKLLITR